jgi:serine/threonine-protein kinase
VARIFDQIFDGVAAAHEAGIVHRDLKPENVLLDGPNRVVKVLDFGLAKLRNIDMSESASLTAPGTVMGTFGYMSPEQLSGGDVDERSDVFALGVMVYEALVGQRPWIARTWVDLIAATTLGDVRVPGTGPEVRRLEMLLKRAMAGNPNERFASVADLRRDLIPAIRAYPAESEADELVDDSAPTRIYGDS